MSPLALIAIFILSTISPVSALRIIPDYFANWIILVIVCVIGLIGLVATLIACYFDIHHWKSSINAAHQKQLPEYDGTEFELVSKAVEEYHEKMHKSKVSEKGPSKEKVPPKEKPEPTSKKKSITLQPTQPSSMLVVHDLDHNASVKCGVHSLAQASAVEKQFKILQAIYQSSRREMPENLIESLKQKNGAVRRSAEKAAAKSGKGTSPPKLQRIDEESTQPISELTQKSQPTASTTKRSKQESKKPGKSSRNKKADQKSKGKLDEGSSVCEVSVDTEITAQKETAKSSKSPGMKTATTSQATTKSIQKEKHREEKEQKERKDEKEKQDDNKSKTAK
ncbi:hypothetical protein WR25_21491 [Diploscapter pachys]|uniref:Ribosome receptor lysine/proline rich domain-containing protein n=1 Tax=Diploscapter pachys TaxID=2018661 RepID=A0A2A2LYC8_9BILA|nr:hypothetical protein WR25_21491 [Diploscapter pachys]